MRGPNGAFVLNSTSASRALDMFSWLLVLSRPLLRAALHHVSPGRSPPFMACLVLYENCIGYRKMIKTVCIAAMAASAAAFAPSTGVRWIRFRSLGSESDSRGGEARPGIDLPPRPPLRSVCPASVGRAGRMRRCSFAGASAGLMGGRGSFVDSFADSFAMTAYEVTPGAEEDGTSLRRKT